MHEEARRALDSALLVDKRDGEDVHDSRSARTHTVYMIDWKSVDMNQLAKEVVCSSGNVAFVGPQLDRSFAIDLSNKLTISDSARSPLCHGLLQVLRHCSVGVGSAQLLSRFPEAVSRMQPVVTVL